MTDIKSPAEHQAQGLILAAIGSFMARHGMSFDDAVTRGSISTGIPEAQIRALAIDGVTPSLRDLGAIMSAFGTGVRISLEDSEGL